jgi:hypothetical protein
VTSSSQVSGALGSSSGTINGCSEFGSGSFLSITGDTAQDSVDYLLATQAFGTQDAPGKMYFVKSGSDWLIDSLTG